MEKTKHKLKINVRPYLIHVVNMDQNKIETLFKSQEFQDLLDRGSELGIVWHVVGGENYNIIKCLEPISKIKPGKKNRFEENKPYIFAKRIFESTKSGKDALFKLFEEYKELVFFDNEDNVETVVNKMSDIFWKHYKEDAIVTMKKGNIGLTEEQVDRVIEGLKKDSLSELGVKNG